MSAPDRHYAECPGCYAEVEVECQDINKAKAQARAQVLEEAAQMCEELDGAGGGPIIPYSFTDLAVDLRALAEQTPKEGT